MLFSSSSIICVGRSVFVVDELNQLGDLAIYSRLYIDGVLFE